MVRPKKSNGAPWFDGKHFKLDEFQRRRLIDELLGIDIDDLDNRQDVTHAAQKVESAVSGYLGSIGNEPPTASSYLADLNGEYGENKEGCYTSGLRVQAHDLLNSLAETSYWLGNEFKEKGYNLDALSEELACFLDKAGELNQKFADEKQKGRPENPYFKTFVNQLKKIFDYFYIPDDGEEDDAVDKRVMGARDRQMYDFIKTAIEYAGETPSKLDRSIGKLFYKNGEKEMYFNKM